MLTSMFLMLRPIFPIFIGEKKRIWRVYRRLSLIQKFMPNWNFLQRHREQFGKNPRLSFMYATWDKFDTTKKDAITFRAFDILKRMEEGNL